MEKEGENHENQSIFLKQGKKIKRHIRYGFLKIFCFLPLLTQT